MNYIEKTNSVKFEELRPKFLELHGKVKLNQKISNTILISTSTIGISSILLGIYYFFDTESDLNSPDFNEPKKDGLPYVLGGIGIGLAGLGIKILMSDFSKEYDDFIKQNIKDEQKIIVNFRLKNIDDKLSPFLQASYSF